ncbi:MAG: prepilin peptidase [Chloroflexota bacterium]|nr:prepilin peptidase [Chloroflexota bacterium]
MPVTVVFFALLGLSVGSFLNLCIDRLPAGKSIVSPSSHCDNCGQSLKAADLVPLFSYVWLKGSCRYCHARLPIRLPIVEIVAAITFTLLVLRYGLSFHLATLAIYAVLFLLIFFIDLEQKLILNKVVLAGAALAIVFSFFDPAFEQFWPRIGPGFTLSALLGGVSGFTILLLPYLISRGGMGAGDVKLAGLIGLVCGFPLVFVALLVGIIAGGLAALFMLVSQLAKRKDAIPFGPFLALGAMITLIWGDQIFQWWWTLGI